MPTRTEFEKAFHDVAEGRDPDEEVDVGGEPLPAMRVVRELLTSTSIMPHAAWLRPWPRRTLRVQQRL
jgi:hypothetical protein